ncbi:MULTISPECIES: hypothetical protein [unclassified Streptomyces]|uniref:hypothetical protein n=1 Tax=unclassified Streptomyces TaxID=2593676 RepID=UPI002E1417F6|nr:hypothetical protein OG279_38505 [Streptomyces sp. NBC_01201]
MRFRTCRPDSSDDRTSQLRDVFFDRSATLGKAEVLHAEDSADAIDYIDISPRRGAVNEVVIRPIGQP